MLTYQTHNNYDTISLPNYSILKAYLQENSYNLSSTLLSGASAGALSATIAKTSISPYQATELALQMSEEAGVWERPLGLMGIWGGIIYEWLDVLLPKDAVALVKDEVIGSEQIMYCSLIKTQDCHLSFLL